jgi:hypothetical protein
MEVKKTCEAYRESRGNYEIYLKTGETLTISGENGLIIIPYVSNSVKVKCETIKERMLPFSDGSIKAEIILE